MKTIQITIDPELLHEIDNDEESIKKGRSAFLRQAVRYYLEQKRLKSISEKYRSGYTRGLAKDDDLTIWEDEQVWPPT
jgi:metal-responsive CopG/Arc/MetJ family transcriptional regulator